MFSPGNASLETQNCGALTRDTHPTETRNLKLWCSNTGHTSDRNQSLSRTPQIKPNSFCARCFSEYVWTPTNDALRLRCGLTSITTYRRCCTSRLRANVPSRSKPPFARYGRCSDSRYEQACAGVLNNALPRIEDVLAPLDVRSEPPPPSHSVHALVPFCSVR